ncbi:MAG: UTP--glucose-1-phosphate uridylyltransferase [Christensenellales bacterium]
MKIKKAVLPVAGLGTRFLSASKVVPKELFPIVDRPILEIIIDELIEAGIEKILLIIRRGKEIISQHFDINYELEENLKLNEKYEMLDKISKSNLASKITIIKQSQPLGFADAILLSKDFVNDEPFILCTGDELVVNNKFNCIKQLIDAYSNINKSIIGVSYTEDEQLCNYGIIKGVREKDYFNIIDIVEKPIFNAPSNFAINGKYLMEAKIFDIIEKQAKELKREVLFTDCLVELAKEGNVVGYELKGKRYDTGDKFGFIKANIEYGLENEKVKDKLKKYLRSLVSEL